MCPLNLGKVWALTWPPKYLLWSTSHLMTDHLGLIVKGDTTNIHKCGSATHPAHHLEEHWCIDPHVCHIIGTERTHHNDL